MFSTWCPSDLAPIRVLRTPLCNPRSSVIFRNNWLAGGSTTPTAADRLRRPRSFDLDAHLLDQLAPAIFLALEIAVEFLGRLRDHDEAFVDAEPLEGLGLNGGAGRFVEGGDHLGRRF